jgi:peptidylprolyl isomerase
LPLTNSINFLFFSIKYFLLVKGMSVVNSIKKGDFIRKLGIIRVGNEAKKFQTNEAAFQAQNKKYLIEKNKKLMEFVKGNYPNAKATGDGYFVQVNQTGRMI